MKILVLLIPFFLSFKAMAAGPNCRSIFESNSVDIQAKVDELSEALGLLNLNARLQLEEYHFRPEFKRSTYFKAGLIDYLATISNQLASTTLNLRKVAERKNKLIKEIPSDNEEFQKLAIVDANLDFEAKYLGRIKALEVLLRSHLALMPLDIDRSANMTKGGGLSLASTQELQNEKMKSAQILIDMLEGINKLSGLQQPEGISLSAAQKSELLSDLDLEAKTLIRRLQFRFRIDSTVAETLQREWDKILSRQSKNIYAPYIERVNRYPSWAGPPDLGVLPIDID